MRLKRVAEGRARGLAAFEALEEVGDLMDEGVLVADLQARPNFRDGLATDYVTDAVLKSAQTRRWEKVKKVK